MTKKQEKKLLADTPFRIHHFWYGLGMEIAGWLIPFISGVHWLWGAILFVLGLWVCGDDFLADHLKITTQVSKIHKKLCLKEWYRKLYEKLGGKCNG